MLSVLCMLVVVSCRKYVNLMHAQGMVCAQIHISVKQRRGERVETMLMANETVAEECKKQTDLLLTGLLWVFAVQMCLSSATNESPGRPDSVSARRIAAASCQYHSLLPTNLQNIDVTTHSASVTTSTKNSRLPQIYL